jgi:hypothetical protein
VDDADDLSDGEFLKDDSPRGKVATEVKISRLKDIKIGDEVLDNFETFREALKDFFSQPRSFKVGDVFRVPFQKS